MYEKANSAKNKLLENMYYKGETKIIELST